MAGLSPAARALVEAAELLVGGERHLAFVPQQPGQQRLVWGKPLLETIDRILAQRGRRVCVLASGDPQWFGAGAPLAKRVPAEEPMILDRKRPVKGKSVSVRVDLGGRRRIDKKKNKRN